MNEEWHKKTKEMILEVLAKYFDEDVGIFLFGSRALNKQKTFSDFDIGLIGDRALDFRKMEEAKEELVNTNLPFKVDLVDFYDIDDNFKSIATKEIIVWQNPEKVESWLKSSKN